MKNILVTGGAGYIGSHAVKLLSDSGYNVIIVDNLSRGFERLVQGKKILKGDIGDHKFLTDVFKNNKIDAVMHFAAFALVGESVEKPLKYFTNNTIGSINLLRVMLENNVNNLIFSSTAATYGIPEVSPIPEDYPTKPINPYGESKLAIEHILKSTSLSTDLKYVSLRYFNAAGAHESGEIGEMHDPETHIIPLIINSLLNDSEFTIFGEDYDTQDGTCIRDYIHVSDLIKAHMLALDHLFKGGQCNVYNLGNGNGFSNLEVVKAVEEVACKNVKFKMGKRRLGDPAALVASSEKIKQELNWKPDYPELERIIETAYRWHKGLSSQ